MTLDRSDELIFRVVDEVQASTTLPREELVPLVSRVISMFKLMEVVDNADEADLLEWSIVAGVRRWFHSQSHVCTTAMAREIAQEVVLYHGRLAHAEDPSVIRNLLWLYHKTDAVDEKFALKSAFEEIRRLRSLLADQALS